MHRSIALLTAALAALALVLWPTAPRPPASGGSSGLARVASAASIAAPGRAIEGRLLFVKDGNLWLWEGEAARQLTQGETWRQPQFSPDGERIAYVYLSTYFSDIFTMTASGESFTRLTRGQSSILEENDWAFRPTWSPDGRQIAYVSDAASSNPALWVMNRDGSGKRHIAPGGAMAGAVDSLSWSPDGRQIAATAYRDNAAPVSQIYVVEPASGARRALTELPGGALDPAWSPDGRWIAFAARDGRRTILHVMRADGSEVHPIAEQSPSRSPTWSPDGRHLAFLSAQSGSFEIWLLDVIPDGGETLRFTNPRQLSDSLGVDAVSGLSWAR